MTTQSRRNRFLASGWVIALVMLLTIQPDYAADSNDQTFPYAPLNESVIRIPGEDPPAVTLLVTIFHPNGAGPFPLAIMNHGANSNSTADRGKPYRLTNSAFYFLSRGYAVALPMMRGFASSGGNLYHFGCDLAAVGIANARDIRAVIRILSADPLFDPRRIVIAGQSFGGWNTLAAGSLGIANVKGLINFNGGVRASDCKAGDSSLISAAGTFGARTKIPSLWFYGENDELFSNGLWRAIYERYTQSGGQAELVDVGVVLRNSHNFLSYPETLPLWIPRVDAFLTRLGLPGSKVNDGYLPMPFPPATQFAALTDIAAVPYLNDKGREAYRKFLDAPFPRVFVITNTGGVASTNNGFDPLGRAYAACRQAGAKCGTYAVDDRVVWTPFPADPHEHAYNLSVQADQATVVNFSARLHPDCTTRAFATLRLVQEPKHGHVDIKRRDSLPRFPVNSPFVVCNKNPVAGVAVIYSPDSGFHGEDVFSFAEDDPSGSDRIFKLSLTIR